MAHRLAIVAANADDLHTALAAYVTATELVTNIIISGQQTDDEHVTLHEMARIYVNDVARMNWDMLYAGTNVLKIDVPTYPFQRKRYWYEFEHFEVPRYGEHARHAVK